MSGGPILRPLRQKRALFVKPSQFVRRCAACGTDFLRTEGGAEERGPWAEGQLRWYCSVECVEENHRD